VTGTFDAVTASGEVNATTVLTTLIVLAIFDPVAVLVDSTVVATALVAQAIFDAVTVANEVNVTTVLTALPVTSIFDPVSATSLNAYLRPVSDTSAAGWESAPTAAQPLWQQVDEVAADDADYIYAMDPNP